MSERSGQLSLPMSSSSAEASLAKTCPARERARALLAAARDSGVSSLVWSVRCDPLGSWWRTSPAVRLNGSTRSCVSWTHSAMTAFRARCRRAMSELLTAESDSSLLPTLTVNGNYNRKGASPNCGDGLRTALLPTLLSSAEDKGGSTYGRGNLTLRGTLQQLPTLTAASYGSSNNGSPGDGRAEYATKAKPSLERMAQSGMLPTLTTRDEKGPGPAAKSRGGKDLPLTLGGHLNPEWCLWFMGFAAGWLDVDDAPAFVRSVTRSCPSAPKSSGG
jgi:hypothetical protein